MNGPQYHVIRVLPLMFMIMLQRENTDRQTCSEAKMKWTGLWNSYNWIIYGDT
jgi:hypothetical protein